MKTSDKKDQRKVKGALARAEALSKEERSAIASKAAKARWALPEAIHTGTLKVADIPCAVLEDGTRVLWQQGFLRAIGRTGRAMEAAVDEGLSLPVFLRAANLKPFITQELEEASKPIAFRPIISSRGGVSYGYKAELLPQVCEVFLKALDAGALKPNQIHIAEKCKILVRGLAQVGIIALVDEATGYQYDRARDALQTILERFIDNELKKWIKTFPDEFYKQIARLRGYKLTDINKRGFVYAQATNYLIYRRLAPGVLRELQRLTPKDSKGRRKHKYFQRLTEDVGHPALRELLSNQIVLMKLFGEGEWKKFDEAMNKVIPIYGDLPLFDNLDEAEQNQLTASSAP